MKFLLASRDSYGPAGRRILLSSFLFLSLFIGATMARDHFSVADDAAATESFKPDRRLILTALEDLHVDLYLYSMLFLFLSSVSHRLFHGRGRFLFSVAIPGVLVFLPPAGLFAYRMGFLSSRMTEGGSILSGAGLLLYIAFLSYRILVDERRQDPGGRATTGGTGFPRGGGHA